MGWHLKTFSGGKRQESGLEILLRLKASKHFDNLGIDECQRQGYRQDSVRKPSGGCILRLMQLMTKRRMVFTSDIRADLMYID